jgi:hypothetical protein
MGGSIIAVSDTLPSPWDHRCLPAFSVGAPCTIIRPQTHLIFPKDPGLLILGLSSDLQSRQERDQDEDLNKAGIGMASSFRAVAKGRETTYRSHKPEESRKAIGWQLKS